MFPHDTIRPTRSLRTRVLPLTGLAVCAAVTLTACGEPATEPGGAAETSASASTTTPSTPSPSVPTSLDPSVVTPPQEPKGTIPGSTPLESVTADLSISVLAGPQARPVTWTLTCAPEGGDHPNVTAACNALARSGGAAAFRLPPQPCTMQYGGPATATVTGTVDGTAVNAQLAQNDGCHISQWNALAPLLGTYSEG